LLFFSIVHDIIYLNPRRERGAILQRMDPISRTKIMMWSILANPLTLLLPIEETVLLKMMTVTKIKKLTLNVVGTKNARSSLQIPPKWLLEIVFSMTTKAVRTCLVTLKM